MVYVFGKKRIDVEDCVSQFVQSLRSSGDGEYEHRKVVLVKCDVGYSHQAGMVSSPVTTTKYLVYNFPYA